MKFKFYEIKMIERQEKFTYIGYKGIVCFNEEGKYIGYIKTFNSNNENKNVFDYFKSLNSPKTEKRNIAGIVVPNKGISLNFLDYFMQNEGFVVLLADKNGKNGFFRQSKNAYESIYYAEFNPVNEETFDYNKEMNELLKANDAQEFEDKFKNAMKICGLKYDDKFYQSVIELNYEKTYSGLKVYKAQIYNTK